MRILLIDDDEWIRDSLNLFFEGEGCQLLALETAEEAMEALNRQDYDILIADYRLPGLDGLEFFKRIHESHPHAIRVLLTAYRSDQVVSEMTKLGIEGFIEKPFTTNTIEASLYRLIENRQRKDRNTHSKHSGEGQDRMQHADRTGRRDPDALAGQDMG